MFGIEIGTPGGALILTGVNIVVSALVALLVSRRTIKRDRTSKRNASFVSVVKYAETLKGIDPSDEDTKELLREALTGLQIEKQNPEGCMMKGKAPDEWAACAVQTIRQGMVLVGNLFRTGRHEMNPRLPDPHERLHEVRQLLDQLVEHCRPK